MSNPWDEEFAPSAGARNTLRWAHDVPEVLGHDDTVEDVREELELGIGIVGPDALLTSLL